MVGATPKKVVVGKQTEQVLRSKASRQPPYMASASAPVSAFQNDELQPISQINPFLPKLLFGQCFIIATETNIGQMPTPIGEEFLKGVGGNIYVYLQEHLH